MRTMYFWLAGIVGLAVPGVQHAVAATDTIQGRAEALNVFFYMGALLMVSIALYIVPSIVARVRHHNNTTAIFILNLFLGWTLIGWVGALVWALTNDVDLEARNRPMPGLTSAQPQRVEPRSQSTTNRPSVADELHKLIALKEAGALSEEEFERQRSRLLT